LAPDQSVIGLPVIVPQLEIRFIAGETELGSLLDNLFGGTLGAAPARR